MFRGRRGFPVLFLACALSAVSCFSIESWAGIDPFSPESMKSAREEKKRVEEYRMKIKKLTKTGGEEGSRGLREIITGGDTPYKSVYEAIKALGTLKRPEDVEFLFEWPIKYQVEEVRKYGEPDYTTFTAIATIGGEEACRLLNGFFKEALRADSYKLNFGRYAAILTMATCLKKEELVDLARSTARDMWADNSLHSTALTYLAEAGDVQAKTTIQKLDATGKSFFNVSPFPVELVPSVLHDPEVPWYSKVRLMNTVSTGKNGSKEELFDLYFDLAALLVAERPDLRYGKSQLASWARYLTNYNSLNKSTWTRTDAVTYLEEKRRRYRQELNETAFKHMDGIITEALRWHSLNLKEFERLNSAEKRPSKTEPRAAPPHPEPTFTSLGSRLRNAELFVFDEKLRWYGLWRLDLFLAAVAKEIAVMCDEAQVQLLRQKALRALSIEQAGKAQGIAAASVLMPLPLDYVFEGTRPEWSPQTADFSAAFTTGQEKLVIMRLLHEGSASCWVNAGPGSTAGKERAFRFREEHLPVGSWVVLSLGSSADQIPVYLSGDGETFSRGYRLLPDGSQEQFTIEESAIENTKKRFGEARKILERYEQETIAAAGGVSGVQKFRESLSHLQAVPSEKQ